MPRTAREVLIVEDDVPLRDLYTAAFRFAGFKIAIAGDGLEALRQIADAPPPHAVVLDLGLPRVAGLTVAEELAARVDTRHIPIIVVTGQVDTLDANRFAAVLRKPIEPERVVAAVEDALTGRHNLGKSGRNVLL